MSYKLVNHIPQFNFQINRILTYGEIACDEKEVIEASSKIKTLKEWNKSWRLIAEKAVSENRFFHAAYYYRMAEFFLKETDAHKDLIYNLCILNFYKAFDECKLPYKRYDVPFEQGILNCIKITAKEEKGVVLICGGYDSFIEEFVLTVSKLEELGYTVILFEGPGQGKSLKQQLYFIYDWERPTSTVIDYFHIYKCAMIGISWGGYLALRSAAFEKRITAVVAYDVMYNGFEVMTNIFPSFIKKVVRWLYHNDRKSMLNLLIKLLRRKSIMADWALSQGMYITGTHDSYNFYKELSKHTLKNICNKIDQDVLLLAGEKDHYIPVEQYDQLRVQIHNDRSLTCRLFTNAEGGEQHCQIGNHMLAINEIIKWLDQVI
ncbi:alpha/beta hydrolase family protein [Clostridium estertheticum]|uniref:Alpha/beta hydrolase n=1 Tax=Clostridium estertheticum TaxID=238834 RepID=A0A7Y3SZW4_9CLOT|nr:alpha/beta fold hydrolase [Clostridium estertheticum]NNU78458.1 alpha/beta hydrolase [Clostridium estertheticum]WBL49438.1 alpha/beta hydrolase [Clostridium estertheticum]